MRDIQGSDVVVTAYHEAGHAFAYMHFGLSFRYITVRATTPDAVGLVTVRRPRRIGFRESTTIVAAGPVAELLYASEGDVASGLVTQEDAEAGAYLALVVMNAFAAEMVDADHLVHSRSEAVQGALDLLRPQWWAVQTLAQALADSPRAVTYQECRRLLRRPR